MLFVYISLNSSNSFIKLCLVTVLTLVFKHDLVLVRADTSNCGVLRDLVPFVQFLYNGGVLLLVIMQAKACNFTESNNSLSVFLTFFKL